MRVDVTKTLTYLTIHLLIGFSVAYAFTGSVSIAGGIAILEPCANAVAFFFHEKVWKRGGFDWLAGLAAEGSAHIDYVKTLTYLTVHLTVAFSVAYLLTGSVEIAGAITLLEPCINAVAFFFHEKAWKRGRFDWLAQAVGKRQSF